MVCIACVGQMAEEKQLWPRMRNHGQEKACLLTLLTQKHFQFISEGFTSKQIGFAWNEKAVLFSFEQRTQN